MLFAAWLTLMQAASEPIELNLKSVSQTVVLLHAATGAQGAQYVGTGFLVSLNRRLFLVTAEHVTRDMPAGPLVTFGDEDERAITVPLAEMSLSKPPQWVTHGVADVAVLELRTDNIRSNLLLRRALLPPKLSNELEMPKRERPLTTVGYPLGLGGLLLGPDKRISPVTRASRPSSGLLTLARFDTKKPVVMFLLEDPSVGGFSGSPVFLLPGAFSQDGALVFVGDSACLGLVHGTISDQTGGKMAAITPAAFIVEALEKAFAR